MNDKEFRKEQENYFASQRSVPGGGFDKFVVKYLEWKVKNLYKAFRSITPSTDESEAKAQATRIDGAITALEEVLRRMK